MRKLLTILLIAMAIVGVTSIKAGLAAGVAQQNESQDQQDSSVAVIGWFFNHDTIHYCIQDSRWNIVPNDTIMTQGVSTRVMITVEDSTASGYKMKYTILDVHGDSLPSNSFGDFQNVLVDLMSKSLVGSAIQFETDDCGKITKFNDLGQIKKKAKSIFKESLKELENLPLMKEAKDKGFDMKTITKRIDTDMLVDGYLSDINLLFTYHGLEFDPGETTEHEDATETQYENDTFTGIGKQDNGLYYIENEVVSRIPIEDVKAMVAGTSELSGSRQLVEMAKDGVDIMIFDDGIVDSYLKIEYIPEGWPLSILKHESTMIGNKGKVIQKYIFLTPPYVAEND